MITAAVLALLLIQQDSVIRLAGLEQRLGETIDLNITLRGEDGAPVRLSRFFDGKPVILTPVYYECPMLCGMQLNGLVRALKVLPFTAGNEFEIVTLSFDPRETPDLARAKKAHYIRDLGRPEAETGWHFLTGDPEAIRSITDAIGFRYSWDDATGQWAHVSTLIVLTPGGRLSQYFTGIEHDPLELKYSLIRASDNSIGTVIDRILLFCYQYDARTGKYSLMVMRVVQAASVLTVLGIVGLMVGWRRARRSRLRA